MKSFQKQTASPSLRDAIAEVLIIAYRESTRLLESTFVQAGFCCETLRQADLPEYEPYAAAHRCLLNHETAWRKAATATRPTLIVEADFVPVVDFAQLPLPFNLHQVTVGLAWIYTCAPQLYSVTPEGFGEGFSTSAVAYIVTPAGAQCLCDGFVEAIVKTYGTGYHTFDSEIDEYLRKRGFKNYVPFRNYGEHGGRSNPEHQRNGMSGIHHADILYGKLAFPLPCLAEESFSELKFLNLRLFAWSKGMARLLLGKYLRLATLRGSSVPFRLIRFAIARQFNL